MAIATLAAPVVPDARSLLTAARALAPILSARAAEVERLGSLPADLLEPLRQAGLFRLLQPRALGGLELDPASVVELIEEVSRADGSAGWTVLIGAGGPAFCAWLEPAVARDLFGPAFDFTAASVFAPTGRAVPTATGDFAIDGRWPFASGCRHAEWFLGGVIVFDGAAPRMLPERGPDWRMAVLPRADFDLVDNWDVAGLRGTGSNDVTVHGVTIPAERMISPFFEPARHDGALWRLPFFTLVGVGFAGFALGVGRRALDEVTELARTKVRAGSDAPLANDADAQVALARAEGSLHAARAFVFDAVGSVWDTACAGDRPSLEQRASLQLAAQQAMRAAVEAVDTGFNLAGAGAVRSSHPLQRCFRDLHTANQHAYFSPAAWKRYAKTRFGIAQPTFML